MSNVELVGWCGCGKSTLLADRLPEAEILEATQQRVRAGAAGGR
jgi:ABC-type nitrate/sulfonate/bicarbonate transport system ATPase subunit